MRRPLLSSACRRRPRRQVACRPSGRHGRRADRSSRIDVHALGLAGGTVWGLAVVFLELTARTDYAERWRLLLEDIYPGYDRTPGDLLGGPLVGFVDGYLACVVFGWLYNSFAD